MVREGALRVRVVERLAKLLLQLDPRGGDHLAEALLHRRVATACRERLGKGEAQGAPALRCYFRFQLLRAVTITDA